MITNVRVTLLPDGGNVKALASVELDGEWLIHSVRVISGSAGLFVAMPSRKTSAGEYRDIVHPITRETREELEAAVLAAYDEAVAKRQG